MYKLNRQLRKTSKSTITFSVNINFYKRLVCDSRIEFYNVTNSLIFSNTSKLLLLIKLFLKLDYLVIYCPALNI